MEHVDVADTHIDLHELLKQVGQTGRIFITSRGRTVAQLLPVTPAQKKCHLWHLFVKT